MTEEQLHEIGCGSYQTKLARQYATNLVNLDANANGPANQSIQQFNHLRSRSPADVYCFYWDQVSDVQYIFVLIISSNLELS